MSGAAGEAYAPARASRSRELVVRAVPYHVREWGPADGRPLILLHGARDTSASFQFLVDSLAGEWRILAPDWRGHGRSGDTPGSYWLANFVGDLDALLDQLVPDGPVTLVGHSMGGNIAALYSALRPQRVAPLIMLDALGNTLDTSPVRIAEVLRGDLDLQRDARPPRAYDSLAAMAERLMSANRRLDPSRAAFLAAATARPLPGGGFAWPYDPTFRKSLPTVHSVGEWGECWNRIATPVLLLLSSDPRPHAASHYPDHVAARTAYFRDISVRRIADTSHNLHHDVPQLLAEAIAAFADRSILRLEPVQSIA